MHYNGDNSFLFVNGKEIFKFKANNENLNFPTRFCIGSKSDFMLLSLEKYLWEEMFTNFQLITLLLISQHFKHSQIFDILYHKNIM